MNKRFDFGGAGEVKAVSERPAVAGSGIAASGTSGTSLFEEHDELPPTWSREGKIFHTTEKCSRLRAIKRNNRESGRPGMREHCLNCKDIMATKRRG